MERFLDYFVPERYKLDLFIDKHAKTISGTVEIIGKVLSETVKFHGNMTGGLCRIQGKGDVV